MAVAKLRGLPSLPFAPSADLILKILRGEYRPEDFRREMARTLIRRPDGDTMWLSIPVEGGARMVKTSKDFSGLLLSGHGNWRHVHLGALEASYGRAPYFPYLMPLLREVYEGDFHTLAGFNLAILEAIFSFLNMGTAFDYEWPISLAVNPHMERGIEIANQIDPRLSMIDAAMKLGPESLLGLCSLADR